ncbi:MAG: two-component system sensor histidine kinase NtrB [Gemmataceae bacterium]
MNPHAEQMNELAEMTGGFVHDMKNHLGTVMLNLQLLAEDFAEAQSPRERRAQNRIQVMTTECQRLVNLSNDFLRYARLDDPRPQATDLDQLVPRVMDFLAPTARLQAIDLHWFPAADLPPVWIDPELFERVLLNLMLNAEDAMPGGGTLTLQAHSAADQPQVILEVIDTGSGIPADLLPRLFKPFLTTKPNGNGLGLATARKILHAMHASISVQSAEGHGTKFTITLPTGPIGAQPGILQ